MESLEHIIEVIFPFSVIIGIISPIVVILILRALISALFFDDEQFAEFRENGYSRTLVWMPLFELMWEYRYISSTLSKSRRPHARFYLIAWRWTYYFYFLTIVVFVAAITISLLNE